MFPGSMFSFLYLETPDPCCIYSPRENTPASHLINQHYASLWPSYPNLSVSLHRNRRFQHTLDKSYDYITASKKKHYICSQRQCMSLIPPSARTCKMYKPCMWIHAMNFNDTFARVLTNQDCVPLVSEGTKTSSVVFLILSSILAYTRL